MPSFKNGPSAQWRFVLIEASLRVAARRSLALPMPARENLVVGRRSAEPRAIFKLPRDVALREEAKAFALQNGCGAL
jgi:hypothetical protein